MKYNTDRFKFNAELEEMMLGEMVVEVGSLYLYLDQVDDRRDPRGVRYDLADVLTLLVLAKLAGEDGPTGMAEWLSHRAEALVRLMGLPRASMPHATTISRILGEAVKVEQLEAVLQRYWDHVAQGSREVVVAIDGKVLRGTIPTGASHGGVHLLAAYLPGEGLVLMQVEVESKENEIVAAPKLLEMIDLRNKVVIGDALHTQRPLSIQIVTAGGDFIWMTKGNQPETEAAIAHLFEPEPLQPGAHPTPTDFQSATTVNKGHGRLERRTLTTSAMLNDYLTWPHVAQVFKLERHFLKLTTGVVTTQITYGLTSFTPAEADPARLLQLIRTYWQIENGLHYPRDVSFNEDRCRLKIGHAARTMATLNNLALALLRRLDFATVPQARRLFAARPTQALQLIFLKP